MISLDYRAVPSPCFVISEAALNRNLGLLDHVHHRTGCKILLALKAFAVYKTFPLLRQHLHGVCASGPWEARLGRDEFGSEVHVAAPAYSDADMAELVKTADHIVFNSYAQWERFKPVVQSSCRKIACGLRLNPEHSESPVEKYSPCGKYSRLGITRHALRNELPEGITGLHMHALCEQNADALVRTLDAFEKKFAALIPHAEWINFGGGHHITRDDYNRDLLCELLHAFRARHGVHAIYIEPGEAVALNAGVLVATVLDIIHNEKDIAILDVSAAAHMPDVLDMPYRPGVIGAGMPGQYDHTYSLGGLTCLAGDVIGDYSFPTPLAVGDRVVFTDMAHYSIVKTTMFNGVKHPAIAILRFSGAIDVIREFDYDDYKHRMS